MTEEIKTFFVDGGCTGNEQKDPSKRRALICFVDTSIPNHRELADLLPQVGISGPKLKFPSNNVSEIVAIWSAMKYSYQHGYKNIIIKSDSFTSICWFKSGKLKNRKINDPEYVEYVLGRINKLKPWFNSIQIEQISREVNEAGKIIEEKYEL